MRERMLRGELYRFEDPELAADYARAQALLERYNVTRHVEQDLRDLLLRELLGEVGEGVVIRPSFRCDYGRHITIAARTFVNYDCVMLDVAPIRIGVACQIATCVQLLTATHPIDPEARRLGWESAAPITIGDNVWLGGGGDKDAHILKFTRQGKFLLQIGHQGKGQGSNDTQNLGAAAHMVVDAGANELYVADGYVNHRLIVFDATTGAYKRHWGAYGRTPDDSYFTKAGEVLPGPFSGRVQNENKPSQYEPNGPPPPQFRIVHAVRISRDGLVYVCDRTNDRLQVFRKDGTFVQEVFIAKDTFGSGSVWDIGFSTDPEQTFAIVIDGTNQQVYVLRRKSLEVVSTFGGAGHWAGQFYGAHNLAVDSKGNLYITETYEGKRVQRFTWVP